MVRGTVINLVSGIHQTEEQPFPGLLGQLTTYSVIDQ